MIRKTTSEREHAMDTNPAETWRIPAAAGAAIPALAPAPPASATFAAAAVLEATAERAQAPKPRPHGPRPTGKDVQAMQPPTERSARTVKIAAPDQQNHRSKRT